MSENQRTKQNSLLTRLNRDFLLFDGGMGTQLQDAGLKAGQIPEELNLDQKSPGDLRQTAGQLYRPGCRPDRYDVKATWHPAL